MQDPTDNAPPWKVAILGASVYNFTFQELQQWLNKNAPNTIELLDFTQAGMTSEEALALLPAIEQAAPDAILTSLGGNDLILDAVSPETLQTRLQALYQSLDAMGIPILVTGLHTDYLQHLFHDIRVIREKIHAANNEEELEKLQIFARGAYLDIRSAVVHPDSQSYLDKMHLLSLMPAILDRIIIPYDFTLPEAMLATTLLRADYIYDKGVDDLLHPQAQETIRNLYHAINTQYKNTRPLTYLLEGLHYPEDFTDHLHPNQQGQNKMAEIVGRAIVQAHQALTSQSPHYAAEQSLSPLTQEDIAHFTRIFSGQNAPAASPVAPPASARQHRLR